jgi:hypothetical protein
VGACVVVEATEAEAVLLWVQGGRCTVVAIAGLVRRRPPRACHNTFRTVGSTNGTAWRMSTPPTAPTLQQRCLFLAAVAAGQSTLMLDLPTLSVQLVVARAMNMPGIFSGAAVAL